MELYWREDSTPDSDVNPEEEIKSTQSNLKSEILGAHGMQCQNSFSSYYLPSLESVTY